MGSDERTDVGRSAPAADPVLRHGMSFEDFFEIEHERLLGALYLVTGNRQEAEDVMQDAFVSVLQRWDLVQSLASPTGYLYRTAMNTFRTRYRRAKLAARRVLAPGSRSDEFHEVELREDVRRALGTLTPRQRAAIVLTELMDYAPSEAARVLGIKASTVRALTTQARGSLALSLGDDHE